MKKNISSSFNFNAFEYTTQSIASYLDNKVTPLGADCSETLREFSSIMEGRGPIEFKLSTKDSRVVYLYLSFQGKMDGYDLYKEEIEDEKVFRGKAQAFADGIFANEVVNIIKKSWKHNEMLANYGDIRHQLAQLSRGLSSRAKAQKNPEMRVGYRIVAEDILKPAVVRQVLTKVKSVGKLVDTLNKKGMMVLNITSEVDVNTYEFLRGQGGRVRISLLLPTPKK